MSIQVEWDNEAKTIVLWTFDGRWTWGEYDEALDQALKLLSSVKHPVDFLYDVRHMSIIPADVITRFKAKYLAIPKDARLFLVVGVDPYLQLLWDTFTELPYARHLKARYFDTLEAARHFSQSYKPESG
jgi:hypothetical protein